MTVGFRIKSNLNLLGLWKVINSRTSLLHSPALLSSVSTFLDNFRNRPHLSTLSHVESAHRLLVSGELVGVEDTSGSHQTRVSVLVEPLGADSGTLSSFDSLGSGTGLFDGLQLFLLSGFVVGSGGETESLPDGSHLWWSEVGLSDQWEVDGESWKVHETSNLVGFLFGTVQSVTESVLVKTLLEADLGDDLISVPEILETDSGVLEKTEI
mmetsp:Transcript_21769/g.31252  ORF Transcript_21769/g.31252 Transcript_21769/m.31252 type:complete len:211 (-) Transcript_21769:338-970(-)